MSTFLTVLLFITRFLTVSDPQIYTPEQILSYWESYEKSSNVVYRPITFYIDRGLPQNYFSALKNRIGAHPDDKIKLYYEMAQIVSKSQLGNAGAIKPDQLTKEALNLLVLATNVKSKDAKAWYYRHLGDLCYKSGALEKAIYFLLLSVDLHKGMGNDLYSRALLCHIYNSLAAALYQTRDYKRSIYYNQLALKNLDKDQPNPIYPEYYFHTLILIHDLLGAAYKKSGHYTNAQLNYNMIIDGIQKNKLQDHPLFRYWTDLTKGNIGQVYLAQNKTQQALPLLMIALKSAIENKDFGNACEWNKDIARIYDLTGDDWQALVYGKKSVALLNYLVYGNAIAAEVYDVLYRTSERSGNYRDAIAYLKLSDRSRQEFQLMLQKSKFEKAAVEINYNKTVQESQLREVKITQLKWLRNSLLGFGFIVMIALWYFYRQREIRQKKELQILSLEQGIKDQEISNAMDVIDLFKKNIREKEQLIQDLEARSLAEENNKGLAITNLKKISLITEEGWQRFKNDFSIAHPDFLTALRAHEYRLTVNEERLCMLLYLKLDNMEIALTLGIGKESVGKSKRRLKTSLGLGANESLETYVAQLI